MRAWLSSLAGGLRRLSTPSRIALGVVVLVLAGGAVAIVVNATSESESEEAAEEQEAGDPGEEGEGEGQFAENALRDHPEVVDAWSVTGEADAIARVRTADNADLERLIIDLQRNGLVERTRSQVVLSRLVRHADSDQHG